MYIAICIMAAGIVVGRILAGHIKEALLGRLIFGSVLFLLFLLGIQIGSNEELFSNLPRLGMHGACLMLACVAGSVLLAVSIAKALVKRGLEVSGKKRKNER